MSTADRRKLWQSVYSSAMRKHGDAARARATANTVAWGEVAFSAPEKVDALYFSAQAAFTNTKKTTADGSAIFEKPVLPAGEFSHPLTGQLLSYPAGAQADIAEETNRFIRDGNQCAFPNEHEGKPSENLGWWLPESFVRDDVDPADPSKKVPWVWGRVSVADPAVAKKMDDGTIRYVSPAIRREWRDAVGRSYGRHFFHVAATNSPVIPGQAGFGRIELSVGGAKRVLAINSYQFGSKKKGDVMSYKRIAASLGLELGDEPTEEQLLSAISARPAQDEKLSSAVATLQKANKSLEDSLNAEKKARRAELLSTWVQKAVDQKAPFSAEQTKQLEELLDADQEKIARTAASAFLSASALQGVRAAGAVKVPHTEGSAGKSATQSAEEKKAAKRSELLSTKQQMEGAGYRVELVGDELKVTHAPGGEKL